MAGKLLTFRLTNRDRWKRALNHFFNHPERYKVVVYGKDYNAIFKDPTAGCGWYIQYTRNSVKEV